MSVVNKIRKFYDQLSEQWIDVSVSPNSDGTYTEIVKDVSLTAYSPVDAHTDGTNISSATTLTKPDGASQIMIQALTKNVRFTLDGSTPTTSHGFQILADSAPMIIAVPGASIKVIQEAATASLQYQWLT